MAHRVHRQNDWVSKWLRHDDSTKNVVVLLLLLDDTDNQ